MFNHHVADIPPDEGHWPSWLSDLLFYIVPCVSVSIDPTGTITVNVDAFSRDDERSMVVLESNRVRIVTPVG